MPTKAPTKKPAKRATKKLVAKTKTTTKRTTRGKKSMCRVAAPHETFWVNNGPICCDLTELRDALKTMTDEQFAYHTKRAGNDFAKWIEDVLCHGECAKRMARAKSRGGAVKAIDACTC